MKCPECHKENKATTSFCIFCGAKLQAPKAEAPEQAGKPSGEDIQQQLLALMDEVRQLHGSVSLIGERLATLERGEKAAHIEPVAPVQPEQAVEPPRQPEPVPPPPVFAAPEVMTEIPQPETEPPPPPRKEKPPRPASREWEQILGGNWLARIGIVALIIGIGFFLNLAFDRGWVGPAARVIMGIVAGLLLLGGGQFWKKRYPIFSQTLTGGGTALLYLSIFAASSIYHLVPFFAAIILLFIVSGSLALLAMRHNSMALALLGIFGAFFAPLVLGASGKGGAAPTGTGVQLLAYIMIVDLGVLALSTFRNWRWFTLLALFGSLVAYGVWNDAFGKTAGVLLSEVSITLIFLIFVGATMLYHVVWKRAANGADYALMLINAAIYSLTTYDVMGHELRAWMGSFTFALGIFYGILAYAVFKRGKENARLSFFALGISLTFLTIAIPVQLADRAWVTIAWAAESTVLLWFSFTLQRPAFRIYSFITFGLAIFRLLFFDTELNMRIAHPVLNERVLAFLFSIALFYLSAFIAWRAGRVNPQQVKESDHIYPVFLVTANLLSLLIIGVEVANSDTSVATPYGERVFFFFIIMAVLTTLCHAIWRRTVKTLDMVLLVVDAAFYFGVSAAFWEHSRQWIGSLYLLFAVIHGALAYVLLRRGKESAGSASLVMGIALVFFTASVPVQFGDRVWTTIAWAVEMAALIWLSFMLPVPQFRMYGYAVFFIMAARILLFDTTLDTRSYRPILNERFLAFAVSIAATYFSAYLLRRNRQKLPEQARLTTTMLIAANLFTIWLLSFEVWDYFGSQIATLREARYSGTALSNLRNAQNLSLTVLWAVYAVALLVIGIARRWRPVRLGGLALLAIPIAKVFIYDVWVLELVYRIVAFVGLGILLLVSAYLYQRYSKVIKGFLASE